MTALPPRSPVAIPEASRLSMLAAGHRPSPGPQPGHAFHRFLGHPEVVQTTFNQLVAGKQQRTFLVVLSPRADPRSSWRNSSLFSNMLLPDRQQLEGIARELTSDSPDDFPQGEALSVSSMPRRD